MKTYDELHKAIGEPELKVIPPESFFDGTEVKVDENLATLWREDGWARYGGGLFWTMDPRDFVGLSKDWDIVPSNALVFGRNALGDIFLIIEGEVFMLLVQWKRLLKIGSSVYIFLNSTLKEPNLQESFLQSNLFTAIRKHLGDLKVDECYGLFPALPLGGNDEDPNAYQRAKLREYLALLAQMHD
ncbi:hypothetical protein ANRL3_02562 [Anaerolineae bacterium]|nr:hypothetical protein ANRL3_02562 [Anaerolineae bacterium]